MLDNIIFYGKSGKFNEEIVAEVDNRLGVKEFNQTVLLQYAINVKMFPKLSSLWSQRKS